MRVRTFRSDASMTPVTAVHYLRGGRPIEATIMIPSPLAHAHRQMRAHDCVIAAEVLRTGQVSITIEHPEGDYDIEIVGRASQAREAVARLLKRWDSERFRRWLANLGGDGDA